MCYIFYTLTVALIFSILSVESEPFDLIIIPVPKGTVKGLRAAPLSVWSNRKNHQKHDMRKLEVESYEVPSERSNFNIFDDNDEITKDESKTTLREDYDVAYDSGDFKIVGGFAVDINLYPYHVAYGSNCGGAIIDKKFVLTAGHCGKKPYIKVGSKYFNQGRKVFIKNSVIHPMWFSDSKQHPFDYDFQILELAEPLKFDENIQPIKVAHIEDMVIGKVVTVTGWGNTDEDGLYSTVLRAVRVPIISKDKCQSVPFPFFKGTLTSRMFCAGFSEGKKDACQGDSGGPAVYNDRLMGMVSFGYGCATPGAYGVYSKVAKVRDWIESVTGLRLS